MQTSQLTPHGYQMAAKHYTQILSKLALEGKGAIKPALAQNCLGVLKTYKIDLRQLR